MWNDRFSLAEAAEMIGVKFRFLRGWHERGLVRTVGRDDSRPGHPHLITFTEIIRLAVAAEAYQLSNIGPNVKWNPGPFLKVFRVIPDRNLQHIPKGPTGDTRRVGWMHNENFLKSMENQAAQRPDDLLLVIRGEHRPRGVPKIFTEMTSGHFQRALSAFLVMDAAWTVVNVSNVVRRLLASRQEIERRRGKKVGG